MESTSMTPVEFRHALSHFATGVTIITTERSPGLVHGMTANSFTSVSLDPFLILVCIDRRAQMLPLLQRRGFFGVNVIREDQQALSEYFARPVEDSSVEAQLGIRYKWLGNGIPVLEDALMHIGCRVSATYPGGDHAIIVGEILSAEIYYGQPLLFFRSQYRRMSPLAE
jgi:flavin reductase (DIM6/NTAB) family NADH-FMN oxidoreductase RutF